MQPREVACCRRRTRDGALYREGLREESYAVDVAHTGSEELNQAQVNDYDLFVLDVNLPKKDRFSVCRELRASLLLTAFNDPEDVVCGLNCGADDYLTKPFDFYCPARPHQGFAPPDSAASSEGVELS